MKTNILISAICFASVALTACNDIQPQGPIMAGEDLAVVPTIYGLVRGYVDNGIFAFKGIPYAKAERFMPPEVPDKWEGVLQCQIFGPQAMQSTAQTWEGQSDYNFGFLFNREPMDEKECFVLNVWSRAITDRIKRPVLVWIHGGGFASGSGNQLPFFDGCSMAEKGDIVVVTLNHRLNVPGFVDMRGLGGKYSGSVNLGMQDIVAALQWVHDNIANFGGDPGMVTIDGQSGGGRKVSTLMAMPSAAGLFHRAIIQSGSELRIGNGEDSKTYGLAFIEALGLKPEEAEKVNDFSYEQLIEASQRATTTMENKGYTLYHGGVGPVVDGKYVVQHPFDPAPAGFSKNVPMLIGSNLNEWSYRNRAIITLMTMEQVKSTLTERLGAENAQKYIEAYRKAYPDDKQPQHILATPLRYRTNAVSQATVKNAQGGAPVYMYLLEWQSPVNDGSLGACHGMELPFMFNNVALARTLTGGGEDAYELADKISSAWINFIRTGNPNCKELPQWDPFTPENGSTMIFDNTCKVVNNHDKDLIEFEKKIPTSLSGL